MLTIIASVLALTGIFGIQGQLRTSSVRDEIEQLLADQQFATVNMSVDTLLNVIEYGLMAAAAASVAAIVLAVFVMRGHNPSRIALTLLGALAAGFMLLSWPTGVVTAVFVAYTVSLLWRAPVRTWFAAVPAGGSSGEGPDKGAGRPATYWGMSGTGSGGPGGPAGSGGSASDAGSGGEPEPARNPDAVPDPEPHWPSDPASPGSGPAPYPQPWPPEPGERGRPGQHGQSGQSGGVGPPDPYGQSQPPDENGPQFGQPQGPPQGGGPAGPGYPGPHPSEQQPSQQQPGYGYPTYPSGGQGQAGASCYPGAGYPYASSYYGYPPPPSGDPYRRPGQVVAAHVLTWVGAAFGLVTGVFFVIAAENHDMLNLIEQQLAANDITAADFSAMLIAAGIITALWSLAVVVVSVFSWRGQNWAAILLTVMGGGYLLVQVITLLTGQIPVLFTIVWVAVVLTLLWLPASRQWYAAKRSGQHGSGPQGPYGGPPGSGSPYPQHPPPHHNRPW